MSCHPLQNLSRTHLRRILFASSCSLLFGICSGWAADQTWDGGPAGTGSDWLVGANWVGEAFPGSQTVATSLDVAIFDVAGTAPTIQIGNTASSTLLSLGAIDLITGTRTIRYQGNGAADSSPDLYLNGVTLGGVANTILRNSGTGTLKLETAIGTALMEIRLGNAAENVVQIIGSGGIEIATSIQGLFGNPNRNLTLITTGSGALTFSGTNQNLYSGITTIKSGELLLNKTAGTQAIAGELRIGDGLGGASADKVRLLQSNQIADSSIVFVNASSGLFNLNGQSDAIGALSDIGTVTPGGSSVVLGSGTLTITPNAFPDNNTTFSGDISGGNGKLVKQGVRTLTLAGTNTYTGGTTITGGAIAMGSNTALPTATSPGALLGLNMNGGTLLLNGRQIGTPAATPSPTSVGILTLSATSTLTMGASNSTQFITFSDYNRTAGTLNITGWTGSGTSGGTNGRILFSTSAGFTATELQNIVFSGFSGTIGGLLPFNSNYNELVPVPEPATWIGGLALLGLIAYRERKRLSAIAISGSPTSRPTEACLHA